MRGHVVKRYENSWYVVVDVGRDPETGKRRQKWHSGYRRRKDAEAALNEILDRLRHGTYVEPSKVTLGEFVERQWLPAIKSRVRPSTFRSYAGNLRLHVIPDIGGVRLQQITPGMLTALYGDLLEKALAPRTVSYVHAITRRALAAAVKWNLLARNPGDLAEPPRAGQARQMRTWDADDLRRFLSHVRDDRLCAAWRLAATTGMRRGEVLGLMWSALDLNAGRVGVINTLVPGSGYAPERSTPKTDAGRRSVALDPETVAALRAHRKRQAAEKLAIGPAYDDQGLVFCREDGTPIRPRSFTRMFQAHREGAELPEIRLHDLRHTHATLALAAGIHPKVVQERLGHSSITITLDTYSHAIPAMQEDAAARVAALIKGQGPPP